MNCQKALVTGATGYVGSNLVRRLVSDGWEVHIVVRPESDLGILDSVIASITVHEHDGSTQNMIDLVGRAKPDIVFHLASLFLAQHQPNDVEALITSNVLFSTQLAEAMVANRVMYIINTGTSWQHYQGTDYSPVNLYAATKQGFENLLTYYVEVHGVKATTMLLFDTYGPRDTRGKLIALLWKTVLTGEQLLMSPGQQLVDLVYIDDVINAFLVAAKLLPDQIVGHARYGVSSGQPLCLTEIVAAFERVTGCRLPITWGARPYRSRENMKPNCRCNKLPGWAPSVSLEAGLLEARPTAHAKD